VQGPDREPFAGDAWLAVVAFAMDEPKVMGQDRKAGRKSAVESNTSANQLFPTGSADS
jgi:hypothetical protein